MKICIDCKQSQNLNEFHKCKRNKDGLQNRCKSCMHKYHQKWYLANKDTEKAACAQWAKMNREACTARVKAWQKKNPDSVKDSHLQIDHGITLEKYNKMLIQQDFCCAICYKPQSESKRKLAVDHCHETGIIRGLLCDTCNRGIGYFHDNIKKLEAAIAYLKTSKETCNG